MATSSLLLCVLGGLAQAQASDHAAIDSIMKEALKSWQAPGAAIAVIHQDRLIYLKGFGVKKAGAVAPVTPDTVFPIGSCTKPFTTLALAMLVDEGKVGWDDPVRKHVPYFRLADPLADHQVTLRDLLCHRTGLAGHDLLWYHSPWNLETRIRKMGLIKPNGPFRGKFQYQITLFGAAGLAVDKASGASWHDFVHKRIFAPLNMKSACCTTTEALKKPDHAAPHRKTRDGKIEAMDAWYDMADPDPAGSISASARDLAMFVRFQLGDGMWQGRRLVSAAQLEETHMPQMIIRREGFAKLMNPHTDQISYGLAWIVQDYRGQGLLMHGGAIDGFRAHFTLVPKLKLGFVLLNNLGNTQMNMAVSNTLVDHFCKLPFKDWNAYYQQVVEAEEAERASRAKAFRKERRLGTKPSHALESYAGTYEDAAYGPCRITLEKGALVWHWSNFHCPLEHWHFDTFLANNDVLIDAPIVFTSGADGDIASLRALDRDFRRKK